MMVFSNKDMKFVNPELYKFMMTNGFTDKPLKSDFCRSLYLIDGIYGNFIFNQNFAYVLYGSLQRDRFSDNIFADNDGAFFYHRKRGGYSYKGTEYIGTPFGIWYIGTTDDTPRQRKYQSQAIRTALKIMARDVSDDAAPKKPSELFDIKSHWKANAVLDKMHGK